MTTTTRSDNGDASDEAAFTLPRKDWDSDFFGREIHALELRGLPTAAAIDTAANDLDQAGVWGIECHLRTSDFVLAPVLEELGFRLVDSRMVFLSRWLLADCDPTDVPYGELRPVRESDLPSINALAIESLVDNTSFLSRFTDRRLFSREESIRYYEAWNDLAYQQAPDLFVVWEVDGVVAGFFSYMRKGEADGLPLYKGVLTAVAREHRGNDVQNTMQAYLFRQFGVDEWALDNTTQVSNLPVLKNHIKAQKQLQDVVLTFYRLNGQHAAAWTPSD